MKISIIAALAATTLLFSCQSNPEEASSAHDEHNHQSMDAADMDPANGRVYFVNIADQDTLENPVYIEFGVEGMEVRPAGEIVEGTGHHHILIGRKHIPTGETVPADNENIHYGGGQTSDTLVLPQGDVVLALQFANGVHASYGEKMSTAIMVHVK